MHPKKCKKKEQSQKTGGSGISVASNGLVVAPNAIARPILSLPIQVQVPIAVNLQVNLTHVMPVLHFPPQAYTTTEVIANPIHATNIYTNPRNPNGFCDWSRMQRCNQ